MSLAPRQSEGCRAVIFPHSLAREATALHQITGKFLRSERPEPQLTLLMQPLAAQAIKSTQLHGVETRV